jgi:DNA-binding response OmpR family regulator/HPt (histidine-containing phosphotransfer) domain-containing protein
MTAEHLHDRWVGEEEFLAYAEEQIKKVQETIGTLNWVNSAAWGTVVRTIHNLRGSAGMTGYSAVVAILDGLEKKFSQADKYTETQLSEEVNASLQRVLEALRSPRPAPQPAAAQTPDAAANETSQTLLTPSALKRLKPLSILVVDDDPIVRKLLRSVFEKLGMKVVTLDRGVDLRPDFLAKQKVDAVILDLHLPDEDGYSICKRLKADASSCHVPIVFISVTGELESRFYGWQVGAEDFIVKPVDPLDLLLRVEFLVDRNSAKLKQQRQVGISYDSFLKEVDKRVNTAISGQGAFVVALLSLKGAGADERQRAEGSMFLLDQLHRGDVFCSPGAGYLIVLQPNKSLASAQRGFEMLAGRLMSDFRVECRVGLAECPTHGSTGPDLMAAAKAQLDQAVQRGARTSAAGVGSGETEDLRPLKIVIVDDNVAFLNYLENHLAELGFKAILESASERALECIRRNSPDLVMLDVLMPDPDGLKILAALKADPILADIPVMMVSAKDDEEHLIRAIDLGAADYLIKPFRLPELKARVRKVLRDRAAAQ